MQNCTKTAPNITRHFLFLHSGLLDILRDFATEYYQRPTIFFKKWLQLEEIASAAAHEFQKWNHWSRNSTPGAWKIFLGGKKMWWPHGSHLGCLMLAHSAFLGLVVVVVFSDGGAQSNIFGYIIGIIHQMGFFLPFLPILWFIWWIAFMLQSFWPKKFPQVCQKFGKKWRRGFFGYVIRH